jgi:hypothetical protein
MEEEIGYTLTCKFHDGSSVTITDPNVDMDVWQLGELFRRFTIACTFHPETVDKILP